MYLMYIDESGDTAPISQGGKRFLVLTGCIFHENNKTLIETALRKIKGKYYQNPDIEIKSNFLRYANPDLVESSPLKLNDREKYNQLEDEVTQLLALIPVTIISVVIDKPGYWKQYPSQNPYDAAYIFLIERFQKYLETEKANGIAIIDPREGQVEKSFINDQLDNVHHSLRWGSGGYYYKCPNVIERILFATSDKTIGIQIADLYCYPVYHIFEYNKSKNEYWRFAKTSYPKMLQKNGRIDGIGLKYFPEGTKKDLKYFS